MKAKTPQKSFGLRARLEAFDEFIERTEGPRKAKRIVRRSRYLLHLEPEGVFRQKPDHYFLEDLA